MTTRTTIAAALASLSKLNLAIFEARAAGFNVEAYIEGVQTQGASVLGITTPAADVASAATRPVGFPAPADFDKAVEVKSVSAVAESLAAVTEQAPVSTVKEEVAVAAADAKAAEGDFDAAARIAALMGTEIRVNRSKKSSSGFVLADKDATQSDEILFIGAPSEVVPVGFINVYKGSIGLTVHKSLDKAEQYSSGKEIDTLPVFKTKDAALKGVNASAADPEPAVATEFDAGARLAGLVGTTVQLVTTRASSAGYRLAEEGESSTTGTLVGADSRGVAGYLNVYKASLGKTLHKTVAKAEQYSNGKEIGLIAVKF